MKRTTNLVWLALTLVACGGSTPPPAATPTPAPPPPVSASASAAAPEPEPAPAPDAGTEQSEEEQETTPPEPRHGPIAMFNDVTTPMTVGYDGGEFTISSVGAILDIPPDALRSPRNILFIVDKKNFKFRRLKGKLGEVFLIEAQVPGQKYIVGTSRPSNPVASADRPFVIKLPLPNGVDKANLAIESVSAGAKGRMVSTWRVIPMTKLETSDDGNRAVFEVRELPDAHVYLTTQEPTTAPAASE